MSTTPFYRPVTSELCQGDVFERLPLVYAKDLPPSLKRATLPGNRDGFEVESSPPKPGATAIAAASCDFTRAILLTYDCEIDKPQTKLVTVALIRPLNLPEPDKATIQESRKFAYFYLPPLDEAGPEAYVDFRRLSTVGLDLVKKSPPIARLSEIARNALLFQFYRFLTRIDLSQAVLPPVQDEVA